MNKHNNKLDSSAQHEADNLPQEFLLKHKSITIDKRLFGPQYVEEKTGITGYECLCEVIVPAHIAKNHTEVQSFDLFRPAPASGAEPFEQSVRYSPAQQLSLRQLYNKRYTVVVIDRPNLEHLIQINDRSVANRSYEEAQAENEERRAIHTQVIKPSQSLTVSRYTDLGNVSGKNAPEPSSGHFIVHVAADGSVTITDISSSGIIVRLYATPENISQTPSPKIVEERTWWQ